MLIKALNSAKVNLDGYRWADGRSLGTPMKVGWEEFADEIDPLTGVGAERYQDDDASYRRVLESIERGFADYNTKGYRPLDEFPALFCEFAELELSEDAILAFAKKYGWLGVEVTFVNNGLIPAEPLEFWQREIVTMRHAWKVWEALRTEDDKTLVTIATAKPDGSKKQIDEQSVMSSYGELRSFRDWIKEQHGEVTGEGLLKLGVLGAARDYLAEITNTKIQKHVSSSFAVKRDDLTSKRPFQFQSETRSLLGAIWYQFASYLTIEDREFRRCEICGKWMRVSVVEGKTKIRRYCSDSCRFAAYMQRKRGADKADGQAEVTPRKRGRPRKYPAGSSGKRST